MNTFIVGGTGFLGYYTVRELLAHGHQVETIALPPAPPDGTLPPEVKLTLGDLNKLSDEEVISMLKGKEGLIYAAGVDDRVVPKAPAYPFFYKSNVIPSKRIITLARQAGVKKAVIFSSYFVAYDHHWPELKMARVHPYVRSRVEQIEAAKEAAGDELCVSFLLLPYIFGSTPGRVPLWKPLINYLKSKLSVVYYPDGGSAMVSVREVAKAAVGAMENGKPGAEYEIASDNLRWDEWLPRLMKYLGVNKKVITLPNWMVRLAMRYVMFDNKLHGKESGLNMLEFVKAQTRLGYLDLETAPRELGYTHEDLELSLKETVEACQ